MIITLAAADDKPAIESLLDGCFGPARHNRTAYRLRDGATPIGALSFVAREADAIVGSVQCWTIALAGVSGRRHNLVLLGPVATAVSHRGQGVASALIEATFAAADATGGAPVLLIGDASFYGRFGFSAARTDGFRLPGPVDPARLLMRGGETLPAVGWVEPAQVPVRRAA